MIFLFVFFDDFQGSVKWAGTDFEGINEEERLSEKVIIGYKMIRLHLLFLFLINQTLTINVLVLSPAFGGSHMNFMAHLADTLTEAGHNVVSLNIIN